MSRPLLFILITACLLQLVTSSMLTVVPVLIPEQAGIAFSVYSFSKLMFLYFAGRITTRIRASRAFPLSILIECIAFTCSSLFPEHILYFRTLEGIALALGMVSSFTLLREMHSSESEMEKSVAKIMIGSGICIVFGPWIGGLFADANPTLFLRAVSFLFLCLFFLVLQQKPFTFSRKLDPRENDVLVAPLAGVDTFQFHPKPKVSARLIVALAATHAIGLGLQPLIAYWGKNLFPLFNSGGGVTFVFIGAGFFAGVFLKNERALRWTNLLGVLGFLLLEIAVQFHSRTPDLWPLWLFGVFSISFWYACRSKRLTAELGFSGEAHDGGDQAKWLFWTGVPSALTPIISWRFRDPSDGLPRLALELTLLGFAIGMTFFLKSGKKFARL